MQQTRLIIGIIFITFLVTFLILLGSGYLDSDQEANEIASPTSAVQDDSDQNFVSDYFDGEREDGQSVEETDEYDCIIGGAGIKQGNVSGDTICIPEDGLE